jgi:hypothetical protein
MFGQCLLVRRIIGKSRAQRRMWSFAVVMRHPLRKIDRRCRSLSGISQSRHSRRAVPMKRSQCAFACGVRTGVFNTCSDIERRASSTAGAKIPSRSWTRKR